MSRRRRRRSNRRRNYARRRRHNFSLFRRRRRSRRNPFLRTRHRRRRHNPILGMSVKKIAVMTGGGVANAWIAAKVPAMLLGENNSGIMGLAGTGAAALAGAWLLGKFDADAGSGAIVGGAMVVVDRLLNEFFSVDLFSGSLSYYGSDSFPWAAGGSQGPIGPFPGGRYLQAAPVPTSATAVRAGQSAQAAAAVAAASPGAAAPAGSSSRWANHF